MDKSPAAVDALVNALQAAARRPVIYTEFGMYCCPDPSNVGVATGQCSDGASAVGGPDYNGTYEGRLMGYNDAVLTAGRARNVSWTAWAWVPGGVKGQASCAYPMLNDGATNLIGHSPSSMGSGTLSSSAKCNPQVVITSASHGVNATAMFANFYVQGA